MTKPKGDINDITNEAATKGDLAKATQRFDLILGGLIIVLTLGFITLLIAVISPIIDANRFKTETYQNLVNQITVQSTKIDTLTNEIHLKLQP